MSKMIDQSPWKEGDAFMLTSPYQWRWFAFDEQLDISKELIPAYGWPDYPGKREGVGMWVDLYTDPKREYPLGRLWTNGNDATGLLHVAREDARQDGSGDLRRNRSGVHRWCGLPGRPRGH